MMNLEELLRARGLGVPELVACPSCSRAGAPSTFAVTADNPAFGVPYICAREYLEHLRDAENALPAPTGWDSEAGNGVRAERNRRLDDSVWAVLPGSPLTAECQAAFAAYRAALNALTVTFAEPAAVEWPAVPSLIYEESPL